jgi:anthranilate phosphoribosyltransferase
MIDRYGFGYLHAPAHHPAMRHAGPVRRSLGVRTVFNLLGPLTNPAGARRQVVGVYAQQWVEPMAHALAQLGCEHGMVVHGQPGIDELSPCGATTVATVRDGEVVLSELDARELGVELCALSDLAGGDPQRNAEISLAVLGGEQGPAADVTALNAAATLVVAGRAADLGEGLEAAREALRSGAAMATLSALRAAGKERA